MFSSVFGEVRTDENAYVLGHLESENVTLNFSLTIAEILEEIRKQLGVVLPQDK